jgi:hypothetical protein
MYVVLVPVCNVVATGHCAVCPSSGCEKYWTNNDFLTFFSYVTRRRTTHPQRHPRKVGNSAISASPRHLFALGTILIHPCLWVLASEQRACDSQVLKSPVNCY